MKPRIIRLSTRISTFRVAKSWIFSCPKDTRLIFYEDRTALDTVRISFYWDVYWWIVVYI